MADDAAANTVLPAGDLRSHVIAEDADLVASLQSVAAAGCSLLDTCTAASITIIEKGRPMTVAATSELATGIDQAQYELDEGPCLAAARARRMLRISRASETSTWPAFARVAREAGVGSVLSVPLTLPRPETFGGLNCYASEPEAFEERHEVVADAFATHASAVVANALAYWSAFDQAENLVRAMEHRAVIEQAKGILMATQHCTADEAFDLLRRASQRRNRKLRDLAAEIVERTTNGTPGS